MTAHFDTANERLTASLFMAIAAHLFLIFGVTFEFSQASPRIDSPLDIILVQTSTEEKPRDAQHFAPVNHQGSGQLEKDLRPATPVPSPFPEQAPEVIGSAPPPSLASAPVAPVLEQLTTHRESTHSVTNQRHEVPVENETAVGEQTQNVPVVENVTPNELIVNAQKLASLQAELDRKFQEFSKRPKHKHIDSSSAKEYKYASYMEDWRLRVEGIGNQNYPEEARHKRLSGHLVLDVAINADGTIHAISVRKPSSFPVLDEAAVQIARLAAPYAPFPENISKETDVLHIIRTWVFSDNGDLNAI
jgi:protein TonB